MWNVGFGCFLYRSPKGTPFGIENTSVKGNDRIGGDVSIAIFITEFGRDVPLKVIPVLLRSGGNIVDRSPFLFLFDTVWWKISNKEGFGEIDNDTSMIEIKNWVGIVFGTWEWPYSIEAVFTGE